MGYAIWYEDPMDPSHGDPLLSAYVLARKALIQLDGFKSAGMHRRFAAAGGTAQHVRNVALGAPQLAAFGYTWARDRWADPRRAGGPGVRALGRPRAGGPPRHRSRAPIPAPSNAASTSRRARRGEPVGGAGQRPCVRLLPPAGFRRRLQLPLPAGAAALKHSACR